MNTHIDTHTYAKTENQGAAREKTEKKRYDHRETKKLFCENESFSKSVDYTLSKSRSSSFFVINDITVAMLV